MIQNYDAEERHALLAGGGFGEADVTQWLESLDAAEPSPSPDPARLGADAAKAAPVFAKGWALADSLPLKSKRSAAERLAGETLVQLMAGLCRRFSHVHRAAMYSELTGGYQKWVRVDDLNWDAAERWRGLLPSREAVLREQDRIPRRRR